jgi:hypothetical protein
LRSQDLEYSRENAVVKRFRPLRRKLKQLTPWLLLCGVAATPSGAEPTEQPAVGLDRLLRIPPSVQLETNERGHYTKAQWREKFDKARADIQAAKDDLREAQEALAESPSAGTAWQMGAPGLGAVDQDLSNTETPLDPGLSKTIRNSREALAAAERRLAELDVEANLANVPPDWRGTPVADAEPAGSQARK